MWEWQGRPTPRSSERRRKRLKYLKSAGYDNKTIIFCFEIILPWHLLQPVTTVDRLPHNGCSWSTEYVFCGWSTGAYHVNKVIHITFTDIVRVHGQRPLSVLYFVDVRCTILPAIGCFVCVYTGNRKGPSNRSQPPSCIGTFTDLDWLLSCICLQEEICTTLGIRVRKIVLNFRLANWCFVENWKLIYLGSLKIYPTDKCNHFCFILNWSHCFVCLHNLLISTVEFGQAARISNSVYKWNRTKLSILWFGPIQYYWFVMILFSFMLHINSYHKPKIIFLLFSILKYNSCRRMQHPLV